MQAGSVGGKAADARPKETGAAAARTEQLYARHHRMVAGLCRALLRNPAEAEDAAQQAFLSAHRALLNGADPREPAAWLAAIARNECRGRIGARMRAPLATDETETIAGGVDPVDEALRRADLAALWRAIRALPPAQRDALLLREFGGLRYDELAAALAVTEPAVESLLVRARTRLRSQLKAAYAALTGGAWLEWLARVAAGGTAPAVATKAVTLSLGAAAVTSGAVVGPRLPVHHTHHRPARVHAVRATSAAPAPRSAPPTVAAALLPPAPPKPVVRPVERSQRRHDGEDRQVKTVSQQPETEQQQGQEEDGGGDHGPPQVTTTTTTTAITPDATTTTVFDQHEGGDGGQSEGGGDGGD